MKEEQCHPLHSIDRKILNKLLAIDSPKDEDLINLSRLLIRYEGFPGAEDLQVDMKKILNAWNLSVEKLNLRTREIWSKGFRPGSNSDEVLGSGFDTSDNNPN